MTDGLEALQRACDAIMDRQEMADSAPYDTVYLVTYGGVDKEVVKVFADRTAAEKWAKEKNTDEKIANTWIKYSVEEWGVTK